MSTDRLPDLITVQLPSGIKFEATLLKWPVAGKPVYAVSLEQLEAADVSEPVSLPKTRPVA